VHALQWQPGQPVTVTLVQSAVVVRPSPTGRHRITGQGHLRLPAAIRHRTRLAAGDRLLIAACPDRNIVIAYPMAVLDATFFSVDETQ
jgi:hypothetical protein